MQQLADLSESMRDKPYTYCILYISGDITTCPLARYLGTEVKKSELHVMYIKLLKNVLNLCVRAPYQSPIAKVLRWFAMLKILLYVHVPHQSPIVKILVCKRTTVWTKTKPGCRQNSSVSVTYGPDRSSAQSWIDNDATVQTAIQLNKVGASHDTGPKGTKWNSIVFQ